MRAGPSKALVRAWLDFLPEGQRVLAERLRALALQAEPGLVMAIKWGNLVLAPEGGRPVLAIAPHRSGVHLRRLSPRGEATDPGEGERSLRLRHGEEVAEVAVRDFVRAAVRRGDALLTLPPAPPH